MSYSYTVAKDVLSDNDKNRLMCLYLNSTNATINWDKATTEFGAASVDSMRVMTRTAMKKIESAGGKGGGVPTPTTGGKKKRKAAVPEGGDDDAEALPKKKKGKKAKAELAPSDGEQNVKKEGEVEEG